MINMRACVARHKIIMFARRTPGKKYHDSMSCMGRQLGVGYGCALCTFRDRIKTPAAVVSRKTNTKFQFEFVCIR